MNYIEERHAIREKTRALLVLSEQCDFSKVSSAITDVNERIDKDQFIITVVGEFNRGKSTLLNAILGADIIPTAIRPTTATLNVIHYSEVPFIQAHFRDGSQKTLPFEKDAFKEYTGLVDFDPSKVKYIELGYPVDYLKDGTVLVDTPGVNDIDALRQDITYGYMPISDATIFIFNANTPFRGTEESFLRNHILSNSIPTLFFIVNRIDEIDQEELGEVSESLVARLKDILKKEVIDIYPISARAALIGKVKKDEGLVTNSKFEIFEDSLKRFVLGGAKNKSKLVSMQQKFDGLCELLLEQTEIEIQQLSMSLSELNTAKENLHKVTKSKEEAFSKLIQFIEEQSLSLMTKVETSLLAKQKSVLERFLYQVDRQKTDLAEYAKKDLPYMIRMDIKQWYEQNHLQIEQGYNTIAQKAVIGFQQHFSKKPIFTCTMETNPVASEYENIRGISIESEITVDGINKLSQAGGAVALATVVGIATGGIGLPVIFAASGGMMLGQKFAGGYFSGKEVKRQKEELSRKLPEIVEDVFNKISNTMSDHYQGMFEQFKESLSTEYENVVIELNSGIEDKIAQYQSNRASIDMMCKRYTQIAQQVYQLKE